MRRTRRGGPIGQYEQVRRGDRRGHRGPRLPGARIRPCPRRSAPAARAGAMNGTPSRIRAAVRGDLPEIVELLNACDVAETGQPDTTSADVEGDWGLEGFALAQRHLGRRGSGWAPRRLRLHRRPVPHRRARGRRVGAPAATRSPVLRGRLLGLAERRAAPARRRARLRRGRARRLLRSRPTRAKRDLLRRHGFAPRRTVYRMAVDLGDRVATQPAPAGVDIRAFRPQADEHVMYDTMMEAFADHYRHSDEPFDAWQDAAARPRGLRPRPVVPRLGRRRRRSAD